MAGKKVFAELILDLAERDKLGWRTHNKPLLTHDGRDSLQEAYEEALDLVVYLKKALLERDNDR